MTEATHRPWKRQPGILLRHSLSAVLSVVLLSGCSGGGTAAKSPQVYDQTPRPVRVDERPVHAAAKNSGEVLFRVLGVTDRLARTAGSHAEVPAKNGQYVRIRVLMENLGRTNTDLDLASQRLVTSDGRSFSPDEPTMAVKRQPLAPSLGAGVRLECDLWYDIPAEERISKVTLLGTTPYSTVPPPAAEIPLA